MTCHGYVLKPKTRNRNHRNGQNKISKTSEIDGGDNFPTTIPPKEISRKEFPELKKIEMKPRKKKHRQVGL